MQQHVHRRGGAGRTILLAGFAAGFADYLYATLRAVFAGGSAWGPWISVARGLIGPAARDGGIEIALLGIALHFFIMFGAAAIFYVVVKRLPWFARRPWVAGVLFGIGFLAVMNWVVLPLSHIGRPVYSGTTGLLNAAFLHIVLAGLPIAWTTTLRLRQMNRR